MRRVAVVVELGLDEAQFLRGMAEARHCTVADLVEIAVSSFVERQHQAESARGDSSDGA